MSDADFKYIEGNGSMSRLALPICLYKSENAIPSEVKQND